MAFPIVLINSATGSDSAASGAGPATALFGTAAATAASAVVTLLVDNPDLSGVATDGSAVIWINSSSGRQFSKITAVDNTAGVKTVTVESAYANTESGRGWGIGGKRASIGATSSKKLWDNGGGAGDALPGWVVEMESGHAETIAATYDLRSSGDGTNGPLILRGTSGAATRPILTFSNNGNMFVVRGAGVQLVGFELRNTNATKTASVGIFVFNNGVWIENIKISHSTNKVWRAIWGDDDTLIFDCDIGYCAGVGVFYDNTGGIAGGTIVGSYIHHCTSHGVHVTTAVLSPDLINNVIASNGGDGVLDVASGTATKNRMLLIGNTIDGNTGDGFESAGTTSNNSLRTAVIQNNNFTNNGGYGVRFSGLSTEPALAYLGALCRNNNTYNNTSGALSPTLSSVVWRDDPAADPQYTNSAGLDYSIGTNLRAQGFPEAVYPATSTRSYVDIGGAQRQEAGGGAGPLVGPGRLIR